MNFCIEFNTTNTSEIALDSIAIKKYLITNLRFKDLTDKQIKARIIELINNENVMSNILDDLDITYKYFVQLLYVNYPIIFTTSFINKYVKNTYNKYADM